MSTNQPTPEQRRKWSDLQQLIYAELESRPNGMHWDDIVTHFGSYVEPGKRVASALSGALAGFTKSNLTWRDAKNVIHAGSPNEVATNPKGIDPDLKGYMSGRTGRKFQIFTDPEIIEGVVSVEFTPDGKTWYPISFSTNMKMCVGKEIPEWGSDMNIYHNVFAYRLFARRNGAVDKVADEKIQGMGLIITIAPQ